MTLRQLRSVSGLQPCCAWVTLRWYQFKLRAGWRKNRRCESNACKGLVQRLNIRVAHILMEKQAESPTQTSLCATEAQRLRVSASKTRSRTWW